VSSRAAASHVLSSSGWLAVRTTPSAIEIIAAPPGAGTSTDEALAGRARHHDGLRAVRVEHGAGADQLEAADHGRPCRSCRPGGAPQRVARRRSEVERSERPVAHLRGGHGTCLEVDLADAVAGQGRRGIGGPAQRDRKCECGEARAGDGNSARRREGSLCCSG
jgi:hypothetical protein